ncbi:MAG: tspO [Tardiphaga sp.]|uniref:TspO/MBR family protein n=1 Tax=Tardiphaga sp. TaxID=1926292 RepID=UPI002606C0A4|nr:TspO/MBR family protein [Tardiphaga sp.]MDB5500730.1 tspO [Tardiphaga sp.]
MAERRSFWKPVVIAAAAAIFVATLGGTLTDIGPWYQNLKKPSWQPPDWAFGPAWTTIFALAVVSAVTAWRAARQDNQRQWIIALFALNGFLNVLWSTLFFALKRPDWALLEVGLLWLAIALPMIVFWRISKTASLCLLPYLLWVSFAAVLNLTVVRLNAPFA